ncbi:hypothetical protein P4S72_17665 [Vibrio sp. PP-XX7]
MKHNISLDFIHEQSQGVALVVASHHSTVHSAEFLIQLDRLPYTKTARKVLISSGHDIQAILSAVNEGRLDHCLTKPLPNKVLYNTVYKELTHYILERESDNLLEYSQVLDSKNYYEPILITRCGTINKGSSVIITK